MFERFTKDARAVVRGAVEYADDAGAQTVDAEHLLLALLDREGSRGSFALAALGLDEHGEPVRQALHDARRRAGLSRAEADALAGLGIDVSEIVSRVEETHGVGAMSGDRRGKGSWPGRRAFSRSAKDTLEKALRTAAAHRDRHLGDEHILLALTVRPGVPAEALADHGVTYESVARVLYGGGQARAAG
ncbi:MULTISPECIES: Clp protease N-terminal domain-containing protein [unclassified Streptomyces]|uniref:Clp protease N-terminal domain-containing protein n=1 Tax=unclassified Streptomyces TaxID=2593676 RepID=UPI002DD9B971|nr:Clp protease N-terminal domain-containing protein [Streptomyces sp. NBC_01788]WSB28695.1 peptidase [Streptomyces sp. NBC_01788]